MGPKDTFSESALTLKDDDIKSRRFASRRSLLATLGLTLGVGAAVAVAVAVGTSTPAHADRPKKNGKTDND